MKDLYLESPHDILLFLKTKRFPFGVKEIVLLEFAPTVLEENAKLVLKNVSSVCERLYFKSEKKISSPHASLCLKWKPLEPEEYTVPAQIYFDTPWEKHLANANELTEKELDSVQALEICLSEETLPRLIPALMLLKKSKLDFILLGPSKLKEQDLPKLQEIFSYLEKNWRHDLPLFFSPSHPHSAKWEAATLNPFRGPRLVDLDLSNACDHDCLFCGLHHPDLKKKNGQIAGLKASSSKLLKLIENLPPSVEMVTLGGAGEPFLHSEIMPIIRALRERNINVCLFSNFAHMSQAILDELKDLVFDSPLNIWIIANISGADSGTYSATRPGQGAKTFFKVVKHIKYNTTLLRHHHKAASVTLMNVVNSKNYKTLPEFVALTKDLGAFNLWFKPMEPHGEVTLPLMLNPNEQAQEKEFRAKTNWAAQKLGVDFLISDEGETQEIADDELSRYPLLQSYLAGQFNERPSKDEFVRPRFTQEKFYKKSKQNLSFSLKENDPCFIAYDYLRLNVEGEVLPCCGFQTGLGKIESENLLPFWLSPPYQKMREELKTSQWSFCAYCPHRHINERFKILRS